MPADPRVLVLHNRYRTAGGEERAVELQLRALEAAGVPVSLFERSSADVGRLRAARAMVGGGGEQAPIEAAVADTRATIAHAHNMHPVIGPRGMLAARRAGARTILQLHNVRIFCATGFGERDGAPCRRCRGRNTLPGLVLNCRRSWPEAVTYATALSRHQPLLLDAVDVFLAPSRHAADSLAGLGLRRDATEVIPHYLPTEAFADESRADRGSYALVASRLSPEKGIDDAIRAAHEAGVPLRIAGEGSDRSRLEAVARDIGADVRFLGLLDPARVRSELSGAAAVLMPSRYHEFFPYSALEAMAQGVPVIAYAMGGLPEMLGADRCVARDDRDALTERLAGLWSDPQARLAEGGDQLRRARANHSESVYVERLLELYGRLSAGH